MVSSTLTWIKFERLSRSVSDRDVIADGLQLSVKHINFAQKIINFRFSLQVLQSTLLQTNSKPSVNELQFVHCSDNPIHSASKLQITKDSDDFVSMLVVGYRLANYCT